MKSLFCVLNCQFLKLFSFQPPSYSSSKYGIAHIPGLPPGLIPPGPPPGMPPPPSPEYQDSDNEEEMVHFWIANTFVYSS